MSTYRLAPGNHEACFVPAFQKNPAFNWYTFVLLTDHFCEFLHHMFLSVLPTSLNEADVIYW